MNRRRFLRSLGLGAAALASAPLLATLPAAPVMPLATPDISIRFVRLFDASTMQVSRMDVLYGVGYLRSDFVGRGITA